MKNQQKQCDMWDNILMNLIFVNKSDAHFGQAYMVLMRENPQRPV